MLSSLEGKCKIHWWILCSKLSCYKMNLLIYSYPFDDERIKSLESSHDQCSLISQQRASGSGFLAACLSHMEENRGRGMGLDQPFFPGAVILCFEAFKSSTTCHTVTHCPFLESPWLCCALSLGSET